ncbi:MAG: hypothetical protein J5545_07280 [Bacteroidaceae bacterium]|nr:hypothetical protein [Bacteroidaceae bacterium]
MIRPIFLLISFLVCTAVQAQDAFVVQRKNGAVQRFPHGIFKADIHFWGDDGNDGNTGLSVTDNHLVNAAGDTCHIQGFIIKNDTHDWAVIISWNGTAPTTRPYQLCISTEEGVSLSNCDSVFVVARATYGEMTFGGDHYIILGDRDAFANFQTWVSTSYGAEYMNIDCSDYPLQHGQTYYYRIAAHIPSLRSDGSHDTLTVYGPEYSFRIPDLMAESAFVPAAIARDGLVYPTAEAWDAFLAAVSAEADAALSEDDASDPYGAPVTYALPDAETCGKMWVKWLETPEGQAQDFSAASDYQFDDGTIHFIAEIPAAFHQWARSRELVLTSIEDILPVDISVLNQQKPQCEWSLVTTEREDWPLTSRTYIKACPITYEGTSNTNAVIDFDTRSLLPGVRYRLTVTFAPEGELPETEENAWHYTPTRLQMGFHQGGQSSTFTVFKNPADATNYFLQSGTEPTVITFPEPFLSLGNRVLRILSAVRPPDLNIQKQINVLRVAEVRLTPVLLPTKNTE